MIVTDPETLRKVPRNDGESDHEIGLKSITESTFFLGNWENNSMEASKPSQNVPTEPVERNFCWILKKKMLGL